MSEQHSETTDDVTVGELRRALAALDWSNGLKRNQVRRRYRALPQRVYLRLPDSKRFYSADELLHDARIAASRAEGEFLGAAPDLPDEESVDEGGPPAWGPSPLFTPGGAVDGGSAEDRAEAGPDAGPAD
jgi:hypothetical protein